MYTASKEIHDLYDILARLDLVAKNSDDEQRIRLSEQNWINKQLSKLSTDLNHLNVIVHRLTKDTEIEYIQVDLKSIYLFTKVFADDFVFIFERFFKKTTKIDWSNLGNFVRDMTLRHSLQSEDLQKFWRSEQNALGDLCNILDYRIFIAHTRESSTEWTIQNNQTNAYENARIQNIPWPEDTKMRGAETHTSKNFLYLVALLADRLVNALRDSTMKISDEK